MTKSVTLRRGGREAQSLSEAVVCVGSEWSVLNNVHPGHLRSVCLIPTGGALWEPGQGKGFSTEKNCHKLGS